MKDAIAAKLRIKEVRKSRGLTQSQLAEKAGISQSYLTDIENGKKTPNTTRLFAIADALDVKPQDLFISGDIDPAVDFSIKLDMLSKRDRETVFRVIDALVSTSAQSN